MEKVLLVEPADCTGCRLCEVVCSLKHYGECNPARSLIRIMRWEWEAVDIPAVCQQCEKPVCQEVCPVGAYSRNEKTSAMIINQDICIGCRTCIMACPFGGASIDTENRRTVKCDLCDGDPACVKYCSTGALQWVKADTYNLMKKRVGIQKMSELLESVVTASPGR